MSVLEAFVGKYPDSFYSELAKARIEELKRQQQMASLEPSAPQAPKTDPSLDAWNVAKASDSRSVLQAFIDTYPMSFYAEVARGKIEDLKRKQQQAMVKDIQQALKDIRCYGGTIDGVWSGSSRQALDRFSQLAKLSPAPAEPDQSVLDSLKAWKGDRCPAEKVATPRPAENAATPRKSRTPPAASEPVGAKTKNTPPRKVAKAVPPATPKDRSIEKPTSIDGSVYCHQGCAGGFEGVLSTTARNPGMKR